MKLPFPLMEKPLATVSFLLTFSQKFILFLSFLVIGKCEGEGRDWHGHVTALTVAPDYRRLGVGQRLMNHLESVSESGEMYFVDLFVRNSNQKAKSMYEKMGYSTFRQVTGYYTGPNAEDAVDMRKSLSRDAEGSSLITDRKVISVDELYD
jgi:N-terminal acetyltransferase B complex catalytic subunit